MACVLKITFHVCTLPTNFAPKMERIEDKDVKNVRLKTDATRWRAEEYTQLT
jgi:hypothetical protein